MVKGEGKAFKPDYAMALKAVYQQAALSNLQAEAKEGNIQFLFDSVNSESPGMPSWCEDFSQRGWGKVDHDLDLRMFRRRDSSASSSLLQVTAVIRMISRGELCS
jgi:hypothetical protein